MTPLAHSCLSDRRKARCLGRRRSAAARANCTGLLHGFRRRDVGEDVRSRRSERLCPPVVGTPFSAPVEFQPGMNPALETTARPVVSPRKQTSSSALSGKFPWDMLIENYAAPTHSEASTWFWGAMHLLWTIIIGFVAGLIAKFVYDGRETGSAAPADRFRGVAQNLDI